MVAVMTYAELSNYYTPGSQPWLQTALGMIAVDMSNADPERDEYGSTEWVKMQNAGTIVNNAKAKNIADLYYAATLGVRAADPTDLMDWVTGQPVPQQRKDGGTVPGNNVRVSSPNGGDSNDFNTTVGNLRLVTRPIESMEAIKKKFSYAFIDINPINYNTSTVSVQNYRLGSKDPSKPDPGSYLEPGASLFLDYEETPSFIKSIRDREVVGALGPVSGPPVTPDPTYGDAVSRRYGSKY